MSDTSSSTNVADAAAWRAHPYQNDGRLSTLLLAMRATFRNWVSLAALRKLGTTLRPGLLDRYVTLRTRDGMQLDARIRDLGGPIDTMALGAYDFRVDWSDCHYVVDAGAQVGAFSIWTAKRSPATIYAIEPNPETHSLLLQNLERSGLRPRVRTGQVALAGSAGERRLHLSRFSEASSLQAGSDGEAIGVRAITLPELIKDSGFPRIDLLKIDIEGAEWEVFDTLAPTDLNSVSTLVVECHPAAGRSHLALARQLAGMGFEVAAESFTHQSTVIARRAVAG